MSKKPVKKAEKKTINFTKPAIDDLPLPEAGKRVTYYDTKANGLQLRITSNGVKTFSVFRWVKSASRPERITLGTYPDKSIEKAREDATKIAAAIVNKENPNDAIRAQKAEKTLKQLWEHYYEHWSKPHKKSWFEDRDKFRLYIEHSPLASKKLSGITRADITRLHAEIGKKHPTTANRVVALISSMYGRAIEWGMWDKQNPAQGIRKFPEKSRDRFIQSDEVPLFFEALSYEPSEMLQDYFMLLLLTGVRRSNLLAMRWDEISFERKEWRIPETKNGTPQIISLNDGQGVMMRILENHKTEADKKRREDKQAKPSPWVFPGTGESGHIADPRKGWERILARVKVFQLIGLIAEAEKWNDKKVAQAKMEANVGLKKALAEYREKAKKLKLEIDNIGLRDLRLHDLRRTLGSWMAGTGATSVIIGRQLNHKSPSATAIYSRLQLDPVTEARNKAVSAMFGAAGMPPSGDVVSIKQPARR